MELVASTVGAHRFDVFDLERGMASQWLPRFGYHGGCEGVGAVSRPVWRPSILERILFTSIEARARPCGVALPALRCTGRSARPFAARAAGPRWSPPPHRPMAAAKRAVRACRT